ncbi:hypothetical protein GCK72_023073 [Caenorhabditis remanei]|uniref:Aminotransferase class I/classII large domain-containing protein n=1 Tax=Caenorhabditis remanei TaxID=31234 RepID=A0A6A5FVP2_CAERE|nr:hypothetical protein GCK72_023073 [Caenorhabditis remanei]KAF1746616.1 hypothetical protein GCK72_023073 [Caenorhabditis remanei]
MTTSFNPIPAERVGDQSPSIWVELTALAAESRAVNLGQGFPDGPAPKFVTEILKKISKKPGLVEAHQYTRGFGHPKLVEMLSKWYTTFYKVNVNALEDILITVGAYHALYYAFQAWINKGDEVIVIEPAFDCYGPQIRFAGGIPVSVLMQLPEKAESAAEFKINFTELEEKISEKTKMIVINNPHNPTGKLFTLSELESIAELAKKYNLIVVADEVYEFHVEKHLDMIRFASLPGMYERTISIGSAGKVFSVTGWKLGWAIAPKNLLAPLKTIHQNCAYTCSTPTQLAVAKAFAYEFPKYFNNSKKSYLAHKLPKEIAVKRAKLAEMLATAQFSPIMPEAGFFMVADYTNAKNIPIFTKSGQKESDDPADLLFTRWLCREKKLAVIPLTAFFSTPEMKHSNNNMVRICFFKKVETLDNAKKILDMFAQ